LIVDPKGMPTARHSRQLTAKLIANHARVMLIFFALFAVIPALTIETLPLT